MFIQTLFFFFFCPLMRQRASLVTQMAKNLPVMWETQVWSLGWEDPLEEGIATHFSILAQRIPWTEEIGRLQSIGSQRVGHDWSELACTALHSRITERKGSGGGENSPLFPFSTSPRHTTLLLTVWSQDLLKCPTLHNLVWAGNLSCAYKKSSP